MDNENHTNFFIIARLDQNEESDCLSNIYDLSILNKVKEIKKRKEKNNKKYYKNIIKSVNHKKLNQTKKEQIIKVVKKSILSTNLTYKWRLTTLKTTLICFHIFILLSGIASMLRDRTGVIILNKYLNALSNNTNVVIYNYTYSDILKMNKTNTNITMNFEKNENDTISNSTYLKSENNFVSKKQTIIITIIINQIIFIPIWYIFIFKYIPRMKKMNNIIYKFTQYLLLCDSYGNKNYFYCLLNDYSILITKKKFYLKHKNVIDKSGLLLPSQKIYIPENNIFLYCINIINDFILEDFATVNYYKLISEEDYTHINILMKYIESSLHERIKKFNKKIILPILIAVFISFFYNNVSNLYLMISSFFLICNLFIGDFIFKEYYRKYKHNVDNFINNYNDILIPQKRFIYRKNKLIMFLALKDNIYTRSQIINSIEKIINS